MENTNIIFRPITYDSLGEYLMFTDFDYSQLKGTVEIDDHVMVEYLQPTNNSLCEMKNIISHKILEKNESVKGILLLFSETDLNFFNNVQIFVNICKEKFPKAIISLIIDNDLDYQKFTEPNANIKLFQQHFTYASEIIYFIDTQFLNLQIYYNYFRCHHWILKILEKRFGDSLSLLENSDKFKIEENGEMLIFKRNSSDSTFSVFDSHDKLLLILTNEHLLGLYNLDHFFNVISCLNDIKTLLKQDIRIEKDELVLFNLSCDGIALVKIFTDIISILDKEPCFSKIKIQLSPEPYLVINRCLKISFLNFWMLLKSNDHQNLIKTLANLVISYFKCFSKKPIVCRMQSLASDAIVYDFEKFTYSHIQRNFALYVKICKFFYPYLRDIDDSFFNRIYLEVIPVSLLQRFPDSKLTNFIHILQQLYDVNIAIVPLANGNFRVGLHFNITAEMLARICAPEKLKTAVDQLNMYYEKNGNKSKFLKQEDFDFTSIDYGEYEQITAFRSIPHLKNAQIFGSCLLKTLPKCKEGENCNHRRYANLDVFTYNQHIVLASKKEPNDDSSKIYKELISICKEFAEAFDPSVKPLAPPFCEKFFELLKDAKIVSISPLVMSPGKNPMKFDLYKYKERFWFSNDIHKENIPKIHEWFYYFECMEGIYLVFIRNVIETIENMDMVIAEMNPDYYKATADYCFYNEDDLLKFFEVIKEYVNDYNLVFEVTSLGRIKFNNIIEIRPSTFLKIRDTKQLLKFIEILCRVMDIDKSEMSLSLNDKAISEEKKEMLISGAKLLNPLLSCLPKSDFEILIFTCIPPKIYSSIEKVVNVLKQLRSNRLRILLNGKMILIDCCSFNLEILKSTLNLSEFFKLSLIMEKINQNFDGIAVIRDQAYFDVIDHEEFFKGIFDHQESRTINVKNVQNSDILRQSMKRYTKMIDKTAIRKCLDIFEKCKIVEDVIVMNNEAFMVNEGFTIQPEHFLNMNLEDQTKLIEATKIFHQIKAPIFMLPDNWITLAGEDSTAKILSKNNKFSSFTIINDNKDIYLKMAIMFNDILQEVPREELISYNWLKLVPRTVLMNKKNANKLLAILEFIKFKGHDVWITNKSALSTTCVSLPISKWLQIKNPDAFNDFVESAYKASIASFLGMKRKNMPHPRALQLFMSGLFSDVSLIYVVKSYIITLYPENAIAEAVKNFLNLMKKVGKILPITLNSYGYLMLGNFIWIDIEKLQLIQKEFLEMVYKFEEALEQEDENLMQSIHELTSQSPEAKVKVIDLAKILNKDLKYFSDEIICDENLRFFPTQLKNRCLNDPETYDKAKYIFQLLEEKKISWNLKFNGNLELNERITVTVEDLLNIYENNSEAVEKVEKLKDLLNSLSNDNEWRIFCKEEIQHQHNKDERVFKTKILTYKNILAERNSLKKEKQISCRIEPNGTLFINNNLWMDAENIKKTNNILQKSNTLKQIFPENKFQYGHPYLSFTTSILTSTDEQLFQYCYNMCQLVNEKNRDPSDPSSKAKIEYIAEQNIFRFNNLLSIHPRSFFHLQNMDDVMEILKEFEKYKIQNPNFLKTPDISQEERKFYQKLQNIKKQERVEFDVIREKSFNSIGELLWNCKNKLNGIGNIQNVVDPNKSYFGIEEIIIQDENIFQHGIANSFITVADGILKFNYSEDQIIEALKFANNLEATYKCLNLFHFHSIIEIINAYPKFLTKHPPPSNSNMSQQDQIFWWLKKVDEQQKKPRKHKFGNTLKGLHHWFKHDKGFKDLEDYYEKMNQFFDTTGYTLELDTQNGDFINREYKTENFIGSYMLAHDDCQREDCVATFYYTGKTSLNFKSINLDMPSKYLVITNISFKNFLSDDIITLNDEIMVIEPKKADLKSLISYFGRGLIIKNSENVKKLLLFLPDRKESSKKGKKEVNFADSVKKLIKGIQEKFKYTLITLCYSAAQEDNLAEVKCEKFDSRSIDAHIMDNLDAAELKTFIENQFIL